MEASEKSVDDVLLVEPCEEIFVRAMKGCRQIVRGMRNGGRISVYYVVCDDTSNIGLHSCSAYVRFRWSDVIYINLNTS
jgi:hypothetical protein